MLAIERRNKIITILEDKKSVLVTHLSKIFNVTEETIRRDLEKLEREGILKRTYGGAVINENTSFELPLNVREITNIESKNYIGMKIAEYIQEGDSIMLDSSSTALYVAKNIKDKKGITVITNSEKVIIELSSIRDFKVISTGGTLKSSSMSFIGHWAEKAIQNYYVDKAIISCKGMDLEKGITDSNEMEAEIKKNMINSAKKVFLAVDNTKFDKVSFVKIAEIPEVNYIFTDEKLSSKWEESLGSKGVTLEYCKNEK